MKDEQQYTSTKKKRTNSTISSSGTNIAICNIGKVNRRNLKNKATNNRYKATVQRYKATVQRYKATVQRYKATVQ